jgi:hypothetical protein
LCTPLLCSRYWQRFVAALKKATRKLGNSSHFLLPLRANALISGLQADSIEWRALGVDVGG